MPQSLLERTSFKLRCIAQYDESWAWTYFRCWYSKSNNKYLKSYDPKQESKYIIYLDTNNLYRYTMSKFLPKYEFKWIDPKEFDLNKYINNNLKGSVLQVDLQYPKKSQIK